MAASHLDPRGFAPGTLETLASLERRVLWLAVRIVDYANRERPKGDALKVGGIRPLPHRW